MNANTVNGSMQNMLVINNNYYGLLMLLL